MKKVPWAVWSWHPVSYPFACFFSQSPLAYPGMNAARLWFPFVSPESPTVSDTQCCENTC